MIFSIFKKTARGVVILLVFSITFSSLLLSLPGYINAQETVPQPGDEDFVGPLSPEQASVLDPFTIEGQMNRDVPGAGVAELGKKCLAELAALTAAGWAYNLLGSALDVVNKALSLEVPVSENAIRAKENGVGVLGAALVPSLDAIAYCFLNGLIETVLVSTTQWIQNGAKDGGPLFIENPEEFFKGLADETFGEAVNTFIGGYDLCEPFKVDIQLKLLSGQKKIEETDACTLSEITDNFESFVSGNFEDGGWRGWFELTQINNPDQIRLDAEKTAIIEAEKKANTIKMELDWSDGFPGQRDADGNFTTPGKILTNFITNTTGIRADRIAFADEFNELVTAAADLLITKAFENFGAGEFIL